MLNCFLRGISSTAPLSKFQTNSHIHCIGIISRQSFVLDSISDDSHGRESLEFCRLIKSSSRSGWRLLHKSWPSLYSEFNLRMFCMASGGGRRGGPLKFKLNIKFLLFNLNFVFGKKKIFRFLCAAISVRHTLNSIKIQIKFFFRLGIFFWPYRVSFD